MVEAAPKTNKTITAVPQKTAGTSFFRKAGERSFFGSTAAPAFFGQPVQAKLTVSTPDDPQEKEADAVADKVMRMPDSVVVQPSPLPGKEEKIERTEEEEKVYPKEETINSNKISCKDATELQRPSRAAQVIQRLQKGYSNTGSEILAPNNKTRGGSFSTAFSRSQIMRQSGRAPPETSSSFEQTLSSTKGGGSALPSDNRRSLENRFGADFGGVRIHAGTQAEDLSSSIHAHAFTHGNDIYFNRGKWAPETQAGGTLLAHELTHTLQQGASKTVQKKASTPPVPPPAETTTLANSVFAPSEPIAKYIEEGRSNGKSINVSFGDYASGAIKVRKTKTGYATTENQGIPLNIPFLQPLVNAGIQPLLAVKIDKSDISGYLTIGVGKSGKVGTISSIFDWIQSNPILMKWEGLKNMVAKKGSIINQIEGNKLHLGVPDIKANLGGFVDGTFSINLYNSAVAVEGNAIVKVKNLANGSLYFKRDEKGDLKGNFDLQAQVKNFTGSVKGQFLNGIFDIHGKLRYTTEKLSGEVNIIVTDPKQAKQMVLQQLEPQQISKEAEERAGISDPVSGPQPGPRAIAGWGTLEFAFNKWLTGMAKVIVDDEGFITVHGEITPPAEVKLFEQKPYRSPNFLDVHPTFRWGIPYVADLHVGLDFLLYAEAQIGPAFLRNIKIIGNYSTDPLLYNDFRVQGTFNLMGYAGLVFSFGAHAGVGILGFDIDLGGRLSATAGIKAYVEATPVIGYREKADPVAGKKGEFFISGQAELAAQPFLGLKGEITLDVDSPWPIPNFGRSWKMFEKEYPLPGQFGVGLTFGEYILGSNEFPKIDFNKVNFDPDKFKDDLIDRNVPPKQAHPEEKKGDFADKQKGQEVPPPPPSPAVAHKGADNKDKEQKPPTAEVLKRFGDGMKALRVLKEARNSKPEGKEQLFAELGAIRRKFNFKVLTADPSGDNWSVYAEMPGINNADAPVGIKGIAEEKKEGKPEEKSTGGKHKLDNTAMEALHAKIHISKDFSMNGERHTLYLNYVDGKPIIEMASGRRALLRQLTLNALEEIKNRKGYPYDEARTELESFLKVALDERTERMVNINHSEEFATENDYEKELSKIAGTLTILGSHFHVKSLAFVLPVTSQIRYGPLVNGFGSSMEVDILTKYGAPGSATTNKLRNVGPMAALNNRRSGDGKYYILGHLLNAKLHGPGTTLDNLTPITGSANGLHETNIENDIKTGIDTDRIFKYEVKAQGTQGFNSLRYNYFMARNDKVRAQIVEAEQYVPAKLVCSVQELYPDGKPLSGGLAVSNYPIDVVISQAPNSYEI